MEKNLFSELERGRRLSESQLFDLLRRYHRETGIGAFLGGPVPHAVTNRVFLAEAYAEVVFGYLGDLAAGDLAAGDLGAGGTGETRELLILDLGCGSGRFGFHFVEFFFARLPASPWRGTRVRYVFADLAAGSLETLRRHPKLAGHVAAGRVDFALFDAVADRELRLLESGEVLAAPQPGRALVAIGNYFLDCLPQDAYRPSGGGLLELRPWLRVLLAEEGIEAARLLDRIDLRWEETAHQPYGEAVLDGLLAAQAARCERDFLFPRGTFAFLGLLSAWSSRFLLLAADRGASAESCQEPAADGWLSWHGSFSLPVDFAALASYFESDRLPGSFLTSRRRRSSLVCACGVAGMAAAPATAAAFAAVLDRRGPDDFYDLAAALVQQSAGLELEPLLAALRFSGYEPELFRQLLPRLAELAGGADGLCREELRRLLEEVEKRDFSLPGSYDLDFDLGLLAGEIGEDRLALGYYAASIARCGADPATEVNRALCLARLGERAAARELLAALLAADPAYSPARELLQALAAAEKAAAG